MPQELKLNLGCGRDIRPGWVNVDCTPGHGVDLVFDLEKARRLELPFEPDSVNDILLSHALEHIHDVYGLMEELYRVAIHWAPLTIRVPYGASDDAWIDPTHVRCFFHGSWIAFSQPYYWRADYPYRADWQVEKVDLIVEPSFINVPAPDLLSRIDRERNHVVEMIATMRKISPPRARKQSLLRAPSILISPRKHERE